MDNPSDQFINKRKELLDSFSKSKEFFEELLGENEKLRYRIAQLESSRIDEDKDATIRQLQKKLTVMEKKIQMMETRFLEVERENKDFAEKYVEVEEQNNNLANLYVASYQLHSTLDFTEVVNTVVEIVINLIGAEAFALYVLDEKSDDLLQVAAEGVDSPDLTVIKMGQGVIGQYAARGENFFADDDDGGHAEGPMTVIPLKIKDRVIGILVIFTLLSQKEGFSAIDRELFSLLAGHAATALYSAQLYSKSERKISTLKGFLDLLKQGSQSAPM